MRHEISRFAAPRSVNDVGAACHQPFPIAVVKVLGRVILHLLYDVPQFPVFAIEVSQLVYRIEIGCFKDLHNLGSDAIHGSDARTHRYNLLV